MKNDPADNVYPFMVLLLGQGGPCGPSKEEPFH